MKEVKYWIADDGQTFDNVEKCEAYEKSMEQRASEEIKEAKEKIIKCFNLNPKKIGIWEIEFDVDISFKLFQTPLRSIVYSTYPAKYGTFDSFCYSTKTMKFYINGEAEDIIIQILNIMKGEEITFTKFKEVSITNLSDLKSKIF